MFHLLDGLFGAREEGSGSSEFVVGENEGSTSTASIPVVASSSDDIEGNRAVGSNSLENVVMKDADQLVAKELTNMPLNEREKILNDVHGISDLMACQDPSPEVCAAKHVELQNELKGLCEGKQSSPLAAAYNLASQLDKTYVENERFRLMFLRSEDWDVRKTALRLLRHFQNKLELFGEELLCKDITQDDLDPTTLKLLYGGWVQELPLRDMSNRLVSIMITNPSEEVPVECKLRRVFYSMMSNAEDGETQRNGRVVIIWIPNEVGMHRSAAWRTGQMLRGIPNKFAAIHVCVAGGKLNFLHGSVVAILQFAVEQFHRLRMKTHCGTPSELKYTLQTFGIPSSVIPISQNGEILTSDNSLKWSRRRIEERLERESHEKADATSIDGSASSNQTPNSSPSTNMDMHLNMNDPSVQPSTEVDLQGHEQHHSNKKKRKLPAGLSFFRVGIPSNNDILLGRGRLSQEHLGNISFRRLIDQNQAAYDAATKREKTNMAAELVEIVKSRNGRFLKEDGSGWSEVEDSIARTKVANCFRTSRHRKKKEGSTR